MTGRRIQASEIPILGSRSASLADRYTRTIGKLEKSVGHDGLVSFQTGRKRGLGADHTGNLDLTDGDLVVLHDEHKAAGLTDLYRGGRHRDGFLVAQRKA